ncbi:tRNA pseudouridine55 synthase [Mycoplasmoides fastidiosum]|uniref:tRNA pseudouridine synthase B n=1 Tax=Mycoplasmoides fastidiosum TaxID=92758 RepID=A0ABU0LYG5_9BACT|nr:tRNA pseudouridine(55) synthase TruB [Mycoplasmoides fastidiosum]MDQ0513660.1 tRNA pseudouridine55 synthase [Mycoplasmoides fastidiosum]UUD37920.1 tRNA pseudouridine(55) synthase TruB [Mycoplasmoides fastidiosum]
MNNSFKQLYTPAEIAAWKQQMLTAKIFAVHKPLYWTSQDVISFLKHFLGVKKIGHGGTLDPLAEGLLIVGIDEATKQLDQYLTDAKIYQAVIGLNQKTKTADQEGEVIEQRDVVVELKQIQTIINHFNGLEYNQTPHQFSAIKVNGKKLYEYARAEKPVEITPRKVKIHQLKLLEFSFPDLTVELEVSKGFYVRSFAEDFAAKLNTVGYLKKLVRLGCKGFSLTADTLNIMRLKKSLKQ